MYTPKVEKCTTAGEPASKLLHLRNREVGDQEPRGGGAGAGGGSEGPRASVAHRSRQLCAWTAPFTQEATLTVSPACSPPAVSLAWMSGSTVQPLEPSEDVGARRCQGPQGWHQDQPPGASSTAGGHICDFLNVFPDKSRCLNLVMFNKKCN